jgi:hypothetical protein
MVQDASLATKSSKAPKDDEDGPFALGTSFGQRVHSKVTNTTFESGPMLTELAIYYSARKGLADLGVDLSRTNKVAFPQAFGGKWCEPPADWQG